MSLRQIAVLAIGASAFAISALNQPADAMTATSFETPVVSNGYEYSSNSPFAGPNGNFGPTTADGVTFYGMSGIQANGSAWGFTTAPDGNQTAFLQSYSGEPDSPGYITFTSDSLTAGLTYDLLFDVESRPQQDGGLPYTVTANGNSTIFGTPSTLAWTQEILVFDAIAGSNSFEIAINPLANPGDNSIGVDAISITATPLPSTWTLLIAGFAGLAFFAYRRNKGSPVCLARV